VYEVLDDPANTAESGEAAETDESRKT
jgi:hypothetical protein